MTAGTPKTKDDEIRDQVNALVSATTRHLQADDFALKRMMKVVEQLRNADPAATDSHLAALVQLTGDRERTLHLIDNAIALAPGQLNFVENKAANLGNLGYFSEAQRFYAIAADPERGFMTRAWHKGYIYGSFQTMRNCFEKSKKMELPLNGLDVDTALRAAAVLDAVKATDANVGKVLDVLGGVMRERRLFYAGQRPQVVVFDTPGQDPFIEMIFDVDVSPVDAHALYVEFVDRVLNTLPNAPQVLTVSCRSWGERERSAA